MADNVDPKIAANVPVATDVVTHSGDAGQNVQLVRPVGVTGAEGSKTVVDWAMDTNGLQVQGAAADGAAVAGKPLLIAGQDGTNAQSISVDTTGRVVNVGAAAAGAAIAGNPVLMGGSDGTNARAIATDTSGNVSTVGNIAHDTADSGNPVKIGGVAVSGSATPTSVASGDRTRFIANQHGVPYAINGHPNLITREYDFGTAAQTDVNLAAAVVAADERVYVTRFEAMCDNANTVNVSVRVGFGTANVPTASATGVSGMIATHPGVAPGSGFVCGNGSGLLAVGGAGEEPRLTSSAATTGNLHVIISYFLIDETP